jgi:hypothetical protein
MTITNWEDIVRVLHDSRGRDFVFKDEADRTDVPLARLYKEVRGDWVFNGWCLKHEAEEWGRKGYVVKMSFICAGGRCS